MAPGKRISQYGRKTRHINTDVASTNVEIEAGLQTQYERAQVLLAANRAIYLRMVNELVKAGQLEPQQIRDWLGLSQPEAPKVASQETSAAPVRAPVQQQTSQGEIDRERALWMAKLQAYLSKRLHYPDRERRFNRPGSKHALLVNFTIDAQGRILASEVKQSTARSSFDRDVQRQLRKASPVPPPPAKVLSGNRMTIDYPLNFTLTR